VCHYCLYSLYIGLTPSNTVSITYVEADGKETTVDAEIGKNLMTIAHDNDIELEGTKEGTNDTSME
jgi:hypothetical protein